MNAIYEQTRPIEGKTATMNTISKVLIPNKEWIIKDGDKKIGSLAKNKKGYSFLRSGHRVDIKSIKDIGIISLDAMPKIKYEVEPASYAIYNYPCSSKPFGPVYNVKDKLPLYAKSAKSKSQYCAGFYVIQFRKGWVKSFCPKLITLERYPYHGPFKTEQEMKTMLNTINKP
jgi:hypothetical protein